MREWQIGDPTGDGNDIGVPDTRYVGHSKREYDAADEFKTDLNHSLYLFNNKKYDDAFALLNLAFKAYESMSEAERSQIVDEPFNRRWIIELCCTTLNEHGKYYRDSLDILLGHRLHVNLCMDCDCVYPADFDICTRCGKELVKPYERSIEDIAEELPHALKNSIYFNEHIPRLVERSVRLMKSNDCRLVRFEEGTGLNTCFIFEKQQRYFKTT